MFGFVRGVIVVASALIVGLVGTGIVRMWLTGLMELTGMSSYLDETGLLGIVILPNDAVAYPLTRNATRCD